MTKINTTANPHRPSRRSRHCLYAFTVLFFAVQLAQVKLWKSGTNFWPFCSYRMFAFVPSERPKRVVIELVDNHGETSVVAPGNIVPLEFFRAYNLLWSIYVRPPGGKDRLSGWLGDNSPDNRAEIGRRLLQRLNDDPWPEFDETYKAARPKPGRQFVEFRILMEEHDLEHYEYGKPLGATRKLVYTSRAH